MKKQVWRKTLALFGMLALLSGSALSVAATEPEDSNWQQKISAEVQQAMAEASDDELIPVYLFKQDYDKQEMEETLLTDKGYDRAVYETPERFEAEVQPAVAQKVIDRVGLEEATRKVFSQSQLEAAAARSAAGEEAAPMEGVSLVDRAVLYEMQSYVAAKRSVIKEACSTLNDRFVAQEVPADREVFYNSRYSTTVGLEATRAEIEAYAKNPLVESVELYTDEPLESYLNIAPGQIGADSTSGTQSSTYNSGSGYTGSGVNVGMIEAKGGHPDIGSPQLSSRSSSGYIRDCTSFGGSSVIREHATLVACILTGKAVTVDGTTYEGIAPGITLYHIGIYEATDLYDAIAYFYDYNINLVSCSAGVSETSLYTEIDQEVDRLLSEGSMIFVQAAGNPELDICSPGKAYNAITVGNAVTKNSGTAAAATPYSIDSGSAYIESNYLTNKPDIAAPGANICYVNSAGAVASGTGNSFSAPMVTGVIAQMIQARPALAAKPVLVKAKLAMAADYDKISAVNNAQEEHSKLRERSGAGLLNAKKAVAAALDTTNHTSYSFVLSTVTDGTTVTCGNIFAQAGKKIRAALAFENPENTPISSETAVSNLDIYLYDAAGDLVASATSTKNNLEVLEYTIPYSGTFTVKVVMERHVPTTAYKVQYYSAAWAVYP